MKKLFLTFTLLLSLLINAQIANRVFIPQASPQNTMNSNYVGTDPNDMNKLYVFNFTSLNLPASQVTGFDNAVQAFGDFRYLQSYLELDPTVNAAAKTITSGDKTNWNTAFGWGNHTGLYYPLSSNPAGYLSSVPAQSWSSITGKPSFATVATSGSYLDLTNKPTILSADYTNTVAVSGGAGNAVFYLTSDKTSTGTALYTNITTVIPIINDSSTNYTYSWSYNSTTKALTVNSKSSPGLVVGLLTLLGVPVNVANGTNIQVLVKGN